MTRKALITLILGTVLAVAPAASAQVMLDGGGTPTARPTAVPSTSAYATKVRSEALNRQYGNAVTALSAQRFRDLYSNGASRYTPQELAALVARDVALNKQYRIGTPKAAPRVQAPTATTSGGSTFPWSATIGASLTALLLVALGSVAVTRRRHRLGF